MRRLLLAAALVAFCGIASADQLVGGMIVQTGPVTCDGQPHTIVWHPTAGVNLKRTHTWVGATYKGVADIWVHATTGSTLVSLMQWDHYVDPSNPTFYDADFGPNSIRVTQQEGIKIVWGCVPFTPSPVTSVSVIFAVWWTGKEVPTPTMLKLDVRKLAFQ
jgi:hypothetical protein